MELVQLISAETTTLAVLWPTNMPKITKSTRKALENAGLLEDAALTAPEAFVVLVPLLPAPVPVAVPSGVEPPVPLGTVPVPEPLAELEGPL